MYEKNNISIAKRISASAINNKSEVMRFDAQLEKYKNNNWEKSHPFIIRMNSKIINLENINNLPLIISVNTISKIVHKHKINIKTISKINIYIKNTAMILKSKQHKSSYVIIFDKKDKNGDFIVCIVRHNKSLGKRKRSLKVNEITSLYGKHNIINLIRTTYEKGLDIYFNDKTLKWIQENNLEIPKEIIKKIERKSSRLQLPQDGNSKVSVFLSLRDESRSRWQQLPQDRNSKVSSFLSISNYTPSSSKNQVIDIDDSKINNEKRISLKKLCKDAEKKLDKNNTHKTKRNHAKKRTI